MATTPSIAGSACARVAFCCVVSYVVGRALFDQSSTAPAPDAPAVAHVSAPASVQPVAAQDTPASNEVKPADTQFVSLTNPPAAGSYPVLAPRKSTPVPAPSVSPTAAPRPATVAVPPAAAVSGSVTPPTGSAVGRYYDPTYRPQVGEHYVQGYTRKDGTHVAGHYQTNPDDSFWNNYSSKGNVNPHTGKVGTVSPPHGSHQPPATHSTSHPGTSQFINPYLSTTGRGGSTGSGSHTSGSHVGGLHTSGSHYSGSHSGGSHGGGRR